MGGFTGLQDPKNGKGQFSGKQFKKRPNGNRNPADLRFTPKLMKLNQIGAGNAPFVLRNKRSRVISNIFGSSLIDLPKKK